MRSEFEKNRYWIGLFRTDVEFNALLGEFGRYELNGSRDVDHGYLEAFNSKWEAYARAWQHRQTEVDELQAKLTQAYEDIETFATAHQRECEFKAQFAKEKDELQKRVDKALNAINEHYESDGMSGLMFMDLREILLGEQALKGEL